MESQQLFSDEALLQNIPRFQRIESNEVKLNPHNCIGMIRLKGINGQPSIATGTLVTDSLVITAAHTLFYKKNGQLARMRPYEFCLDLHRSLEVSTRVAVVDVKYPKQFEEIYEKLYMTKIKSDEGYQLFLNSIKYDYALLRLASPIQGRKLPTLISGFRKEDEAVTVCGYNEPVREQLYQIMHSNTLIYREQGGMYNIDTIGGQSGSPVFFMEQKGIQQICNIVALHKGFDKIVNLNVCTLLTEKVISHLREWMIELSMAFLIKEFEEQKKQSSSKMNTENKGKVNEKEQGGRKDQRFSKLKENNTVFVKKKQQLIGSSSMSVDSRILKLKGSMDKDIQFICDSLLKYSGSGKEPSQLQLLYRASEHAFSVNQFHQICDKINDTLVIVRTEAGKTMAGYSHYRWGQQEEKQIKQKSQYQQDRWSWVVDSNRRAFLLQLDLQQQLLPSCDIQLIFCHYKSGPLFGNGDLCIDFPEGKDYKSVCQVGMRYNTEGPDQYSYRSQQSYTAMTGSTHNEGEFKAIEYEVFRVIWQ